MRGFVGAVDAGHIGNEAGSRFFIETFRVSGLAHLQRGVDVNLDETVRSDEVSCHVTLCPKWRNKGGHHNQAGIEHELRDLGDSADVFDTVRIAKPKVAAQAGPDVVTIKNISMLAGPVKGLIKDVGQGGFAGA